MYNTDKSIEQGWCLQRYIWQSEFDTMKLPAEQSGGRKPKHMATIPEKLTQRICVSKVAEIFYLTGKLTPLTASLKLNIHTLSH